MKKFAAKAVVLAIGAACGGTVWAGSISLPATPTKYAAEAMTPATAVTLPNIQYTMGVGRPIGNGFTIIMTPSAGATLSGSCVVPTYTGGSTVSVTLKRQSGSECAYDVQVAAAPVAVGDTFLVTGQSLATHPLAAIGGTVSVTVDLKDPGETARIDNSAPLTKQVALSVQAINIYAATSDVATTADVNAPGGPLTGFVVVGDDTASTAKYSLTFDNNTAGAQDATGAATFDFTAPAGTNNATVVLTGNFSGLLANKLCLNHGTLATICDPGEVFTVSGSTATLAGIPASAFPPVTTTTTKKVSFQADGTTQLGTSRTFALSGTITPSVGFAEPLADTAGKNATSWVWTANASQLMSPYMSTNAKYVTRFSLLNTGSSVVGYTVQCYTEGVATATNGAGGTLKANGTTVLNAADVCTFSDAANPRGAVLFTINAPITSVKGVYNIVDAVTGANGFVPLTRPYNTNTTE